MLTGEIGPGAESRRSCPLVSATASLPWTFRISLHAGQGLQPNLKGCFGRREATARKSPRSQLCPRRRRRTRCALRCLTLETRALRMLSGLPISHGSGKAERCGRGQGGVKRNHRERGEGGKEAERAAIATAKSAALPTGA